MIILFIDDASCLRHPPPLSWTEWVVDPAEQFYYVWLQVMILPVVYNWVIIILRYMYLISWTQFRIPLKNRCIVLFCLPICRTCFTAIALNYLPVWLTLDYLSDLMYMLDMLITVHTGSVPPPPFL